MMARITVLVVAILITGLASWLLPRIDRPPTRFEVARQLLDQERPKDAALLFDEPIWRGIAEYRAGRYERALGDFYSVSTTLGLYNLGTTHARMREWTHAAALLYKVLTLDPNHADAKHNLAIALKAIEMARSKASKTPESCRSIKRVRTSRSRRTTIKKTHHRRHLATRIKEKTHRVTNPKSKRVRAIHRENWGTTIGRRKKAPPWLTENRKLKANGWSARSTARPCSKRAKVLRRRRFCCATSKMTPKRCFAPGSTGLIKPERQRSSHDPISIYASLVGVGRFPWPRSANRHSE